MKRKIYFLLVIILVLLSCAKNEGITGKVINEKPNDKIIFGVDTVTMAQKYLEPIPKQVVDNLIEPYWPGALTIVLKCKTNVVPELVRGKGETLGVRIPNHKIARAIIRGVGEPLLGPSANFAGGQTPFMFEDLDKTLVNLVDYVVPGECTIKKPSTVIDCTVLPWKVLREGAVKINY